MQAVSLASILNKQSAYLNSATVNSVSSKFYRDMIFNALNLLALINQANQLNSDQAEFANNVNDQIHQENGIIDDYNNQVPDDTNQTQVINQAATDFNNAYALFQSQTDQYNQGLISADEYAQDQQTFNAAQDQYNNAVNNYNNYVVSRNTEIANYNNSISSFNAEVDINNAELVTINAERMALGLEPLPEEQYLTSSPATILTLAQASPLHLSLFSRL